MANRFLSHIDVNTVYQVLEAATAYLTTLARATEWSEPQQALLEACLRLAASWEDSYALEAGQVFASVVSKLDVNLDIDPDNEYRDIDGGAARRWYESTQKGGETNGSDD